MTRLAKQAGNTILMVLVPLSIVTASFFVLSNVIVQERGQVLKTGNAVELRFALNSLADYVSFAVRQRWCFNNSFISDTPCTLDHPSSTERVMMSNDEVNFIKELLSATPPVDIGPYSSINTLILSKFELNIALDSLSRLHPLSPVFETLRGQGVGGVYVKIARDDNAYLPRSGGEVYLTVTIDLTDVNGKHPMMLASSPLQVITHLSVYKRELNSFALIVPRDLHLDTSSPSAGQRGDINLSSATGASGTGLVFQSPIFVNQNIYLPATGYSPVTFAERVYLGNGQVMVGGKAFAPASAGGDDSTHWTDGSPTFGGFLAGVQIDGQLDRGLEAGWWGTVPASNASDLMRACVARNLFLTNTSQLRDTKLYANYVSSSPGKYSFNIGWDVGTTTSPREVNDFSGQMIQQSRMEAGGADKSKWGTPAKRAPGDLVSVPRMVFDQGAVAHLELTYGGDTVKFEMAGEGEVDINPDDLSSTLAATLRSAKQAQTIAGNNLNSAQTALATSQAASDSQTPTLTADKAALTTQQTAARMRQADLQAQLADTHLTASQRSHLNDLLTEANSELYTINTKIVSDNTSLASLASDLATKRLTATNAQISKNNADSVEAAAQYNVDNYRRPQISVTTAPVVPAGTGGAQPNLLNVQVGFANANWMVDTNLHPVSLTIGLKGYDATFVRGVQQQGTSNTKNQLTQYLNFGLPAQPSGPSIPLTFAANPNGTGAAAPYPEEAFDWNKLEDDCDALNGSDGPHQAFGGASWNYDFASQTRSSWNFKGDDTNNPVATDPVLSSLTIDGLASTTAYSKWLVRSIVGTCSIKASATLVTGFFVCDSLVIESRSTPLKIIGTFIVGNINVDPSAIKAGITWSSIYYPPATTVLRDAKTLHTVTATTTAAAIPKCREFPDPNDPIWNPIPSLTSVANRFACNAISLRATANPFQWTSVDPDCGIVVTAKGKNANTSCKNHPTNFYVVEYAREGGL